MVIAALVGGTCRSVVPWYIFGLHGMLMSWAFGVVSGSGISPVARLFHALVYLVSGAVADEFSVFG